MGKQKFVFLFLSIFIILFSISCSDSSGGLSVGPIPPKPNPPPPPSGDPRFDFYPPFVSPGRGISPQFIVRNLPGYPVAVSLYRGPLPGSRCEDPDLILLKRVSVEASTSEIVFDNLGDVIPSQDGLYRFFVKIERNHSPSACFDLTYILDTTAPRVVANTLDKDPLRNDNTPGRSKTWSWTCDDLTSCEYRWFIDDTPLTGENCRPYVFSSTHAYSSSSTTATKTGGQGRYCIHIQARDQTGIESSVTSVYATFDNGGPSISQVSIPSGTYAGGDQINVTVTFNEVVVVTGTPRIAMIFDGGGQSQTKYAEYYSGSDSAEIIFRYTVAQTDSDNDGIGMTSPLELPSGSGIKDKADNALSSLSFTLPTNLNQVKVDGDGANVIISETDLEVGENRETGTYTVKLNKAPSHPVTVGINSGNNRIIEVSHASLTFGPNNWDTLQTVTVTGIDDNIDNDVGGSPQRKTSITHTVTSTDTDYNNMELSSVEVTSLDDDEIGTVELSVAPDRVHEKDKNSTSSQANNNKLVTVIARFQGGQSGGQSNGLVRLSDDLVLSISMRPGTAQVVDFNPVSSFNLTIPSGTVQGTGVFNLTVIDDVVDEVHETIEVRGSTSLELEVTSAFLTIIDNDGAGVMISGLDNDETPVKSKTWNWSCAGGINCEYRYKIDAAPIQGIDCGTHTFSGTDSYSNVSTVTKSDGNGKYCIHVQAKDEADIESSVTSVYAIFDNNVPEILSVTIPGKVYVGGEQMEITMTFNEVVVVTGTPRIAMTFDGGGQSQTKYANYHSGSDSTELVFRYIVTQTDTDNDGIGMTSPLELPSGSGIKDKAENASGLSFTLPTNLSQVLVKGDEAGVVISETELQLQENGGTNTYTIKLNRAPSHPVTVSLVGMDSNIATASTSSVTFETSDWNTLKTVTVTGVNDNIDNDVGGSPQRSTNINHTVTSSDADYNGLSVNQIKIVSLDDDEIGSIRLGLKKASESQYLNNLLVEEHDSSSLSSQANNSEIIGVQVEFHGSRSNGNPNPNVILGAGVTVGLSVRAQTAQDVDFIPVNNFNVSIADQVRWGAGSFSLTLIDDLIDEASETLVVNGSAVLNGQGGDVPLGLQVSSATITINDNDGKGVEILPSSLLVHEGGEETYTLRLRSEPTGPVVVNLSSTNTGVITVFPSSLTFEANNGNGKIWSSPQTVTVTGVNDNVRTGVERSASVNHSFSGGGYDGFIAPGVQVTVPDLENKLSITHAKDIMEDNQENYSVRGTCVSTGESVSVQVGSLSSVTENCNGGTWAVTGLDASGITTNGRVTITATQRANFEDVTESVEVSRCIFSDDSTYPKWICSYEDLKKIKKKDNSIRHYILGVDIDARASWSEGEDGCGAYDGTDVSGTNACSGFEPIDLFGIFDGGGHTIENLYIHSPDAQVGFFGESRVSVSDLHLKNVRVYSTSAKAMVGGIVGRNYGDIRGCSVTGIVSSVDNGITGGLAGDIQGNVVNSYVDVAVSARYGEGTIAGGLVGLLRGSGRFAMSSYSRGSVTIDGDLGEAGGLAGWLVASSLERTYSWSRVSGGDKSGGLVGDLVGLRQIVISHSYSLGSGSPDDPLFNTSSVNSVFSLFWDTQVSGMDSSRVEEAEGLNTPGMQSSCSGESSGICGLGDGFIYSSGVYPKVKKCSSCNFGVSTFSEEPVKGQN